MNGQSDTESEHVVGRSLAPLSRDQCLIMLASVTVGRVAVAPPGQAPLVVPVNYVLDNDTIVFRTAAGQQLDSLMRFPVSFQVDAFDYVKRVGWSVLVRGSAAEVSVDDDSEVPTSWTKGHRNHWVRISGEITGRFIEPDEYTPHPAGYI